MLKKILVVLVIFAGQGYAVTLSGPRRAAKRAPETIQQPDCAVKSIDFDHSRFESCAVSVAAARPVSSVQAVPVTPQDEDAWSKFTANASYQQEDVPKKRVTRPEPAVLQALEFRPQMVSQEASRQQNGWEKTKETFSQFTGGAGKMVGNAFSAMTQSIVDRIKLMAPGFPGRGAMSYCLHYVRLAAEWGHGVRWGDCVPPWALEGAHQLGLFFDQDKTGAITKIGHRRVSTLTPENRPNLAIGDIIIWSAGLCKFNDKFGHIEMVTSLNPPLAYSQGREKIRSDCLTRNSLEDKLANRPYRIRIFRPLDGRQQSDPNVRIPVKVATHFA